MSILLFLHRSSNKLIRIVVRVAHKKSSLFSIVVWNLATTFVLIEIVVFLAFTFPHALRSFPRALVQPFGELYHRAAFNLPNMDSRCTRYDPELTYVLRKSGCAFSSVEFATSLQGNDLHLRDDNESLSGPSVVFLGDSFTMGFGVESEETFAQLFQDKSKLKSLNAGMVSYGTARETHLLRRIDLSALRALVVQYHYNDFYENKVALDYGKLSIISEARYHARIKAYMKSLRYFPGKYAGSLVVLLINHLRAFGSQGETHSPEDHARVFLDTLDWGLPELDGVQLYVLLPSYHPLGNKRFIKAVGSYAKDPKHRKIVKNLKAIDLSSDLSTEHFFVLDKHLNKDGHALVASSLVKIII